VVGSFRGVSAQQLSPATLRGLQEYFTDAFQVDPHLIHGTWYYNLKDLLEISPGKIQRIEIINDVYIKGNVTYGGVVSIFSRKGDLAGIKLRRNSYFFDFSGYFPHMPESELIPDPSSSRRIPDFRNCLYWNPKVHINPGNKASLEFYTSDNKGEFEVVVHGLTAEGEILEKRCRFRVE
jgi:hypothetical protein